MDKNSSEIGSDYEKKAHKFLKKICSDNAYIKKMPDFKQTGSMSGGLPDYMTIDQCVVRWYEIKYVNKEKQSLSFSRFTDQQVIEFRRMTSAGAFILILIFYDKEIYLVDWLDIFNIMKISKKKSVTMKHLMGVGKNAKDYI